MQCNSYTSGCYATHVLQGYSSRNTTHTVLQMLKAWPWNITAQQNTVGHKQKVSNETNLHPKEWKELPVGPVAQARDTAWWEEEEEHADHNLRRVTIERGKKGLRSSTKTDFMRLRTDSYQAWMHMYLTRTSKEMHMNPDVFGLSNTSTYVGMQWWCGDDVVNLPPHIPMRCWAQHLRPDSLVWPCHTYSIWPWLGAQKIPLYFMEYNWPTTLAPKNEESAWAQWGKNLYRKKLSLNWVLVTWHVWLVWILTTKRNSLKRVETCQKKHFISWLFYYVYSLLIFKRFYSLNVYPFDLFCIEPLIVHLYLNDIVLI